MQTESQLKSAKTFMPVLSYYYYILDDQTKLTDLNSSQKSKNIDVTLQFGYFYTAVMNKSFYLSACAAAGGGIIHTNLLTRAPEQNIRSKFNDPVFRLEGLFGVGYNSKRFFAGAQFVAALEKYSEGKSSTHYENDAIIFQIFTGYRFNAPNWLKGFTEKVPIGL